MNYSLEILKMIFYLILILIVIYLLARFVKRFYMQSGSGENLHLIEQIYLGPKKSLKLVKVNKEILLLGVSEEKIELLEKWAESEFVDIEKEEKINGPDFKKTFQDFIGKYRRDNNE